MASARVWIGGGERASYSTFFFRAGTRETEESDCVLGDGGMGVNVKVSVRTAGTREGTLRKDLKG